MYSVNNRHYRIVGGLNLFKCMCKTPKTTTYSREAWNPKRVQGLVHNVSSSLYSIVQPHEIQWCAQGWISWKLSRISERHKFARKIPYCNDLHAHIKIRPQPTFNKVNLQSILIPKRLRESLRSTSSGIPVLKKHREMGPLLALQFQWRQWHWGWDIPWMILGLILRPHYWDGYRVCIINH